MGVVYQSVPVGSLIELTSDKRSHYTGGVVRLPKLIRDVMFASRTGAFTRGLAKAHGLREERSSVVALAILRVAVGEVKLPELPSVLSTELPLPLDKAEKMAREIEEDIFGPVMGELEQYWAGQKKQTKQQSNNTEAGASNVLNLKDTKAPPAPPPMP